MDQVDASSPGLGEAEGNSAYNAADYIDFPGRQKSMVSIVAHKPDPSDEFLNYVLVKWKDFEPLTWLSEVYVQKRGRKEQQLLFDYWIRRGGRTQVTKVTEFHVFKIWRWRKKTVKMYT
ncbi:hypothetical protein G7046_g5750 [Stylonectria norvegica]|nr:hypothetical protein G7046_g5750 [Stylonectria norvegica]